MMTLLNPYLVLIVVVSGVWRLAEMLDANYVEPYVSVRTTKCTL
jgi:hypothetical protein